MIAGLTGGIGSGKSTAAKLFELLGCAVFNSDQEARAIYFDAAVKLQVIALLGEQAYLNETSINKDHISAGIFSSEELRLKLNAIIHPAVGEKFRQFVKANAQRVIIKETALLFEAGLEKQVDKVVLVTAPDELRLQRAMQRDGLSRETVLNKMKSQLPQEETIKRADLVIRNSEEELMIPQVISVYESLVVSH